jgi:hypothetical protein
MTNSGRRNSAARHLQVVGRGRAKRPPKAGETPTQIGLAGELSDSALRVVQGEPPVVPKKDTQASQKGTPTKRDVDPGDAVYHAGTQLKRAQTRLRNAVLGALRAGESLRDVARWARVSKTTVERWRDEGLG